MFDDELEHAAETLITQARAAGLLVATAESCTGGLIAGLLTEIAGSSHVLERGFVTYSNAAKQEILDVPAEVIASQGAVSESVARAMAEGALAHSRADIVVAVTGVAGPGGGTVEKPVGLVHFAAIRRGRATLAEARRFGDLGRHAVRRETVAHALDLIRRQMAP